MRARLVVLVGWVIAGCGGGAATRPSPSPVAPAAAPAVRATSRALPATGLELAVQPASAQVFVDGEPRAVVADLDGGVLGLPPGIYQVSLSAAGYATWRAEVAVRAGRERIEVQLARREPPGR